MLLFIAKGHNKQQHYGSPPEVGGPAHPGSFCKQNSLPGLPSRPHCVSDSSVTLRVTRGASRSLRPPCARDRCAGGQGVFGTRPCGSRLRAVLGLRLTAQQKHLARPLSGREAGLCPPRAFLPPVAYGSACDKKLDGSPTKLPPGPGLAPPLCHPCPPVRCAPGLRPAMTKRPPRMRRLGNHTQSRNAGWRSAMYCAARFFVFAWCRSFSSGVEPKRVATIQNLMGASHHHVVMGLLVGLHKDLLENIHIYVNGGLVERVEGVVVGKV